MTNIAVFATLPTLRASAIALAEQLKLPFVEAQEGYDYVLVLTPDYVGLQKIGEASLPLRVDFLSGKMNYRAQHTSLKSEALARAMGLKGKTHPSIVDATGGLASDAFALVSLGFEVTLLERSPVIYTLVADGIWRARQNPRFAVMIDRLHLVQTDAIVWLKQRKAGERPNIIYLDPMFPQRKKSALSKQEMLILHDIVGEDEDADMLLQAALACATQRIVVKRPRLAAILGASIAPSFSLSGSSSRFDVYLIRE